MLGSHLGSKICANHNECSGLEVVHNGCVVVDQEQVRSFTVHVHDIILTMYMYMICSY